MLQPYYPSSRRGSKPFRQFACILGRATIMNFRHFLEKHDIGENVLALVLINQKLKQVGLMLRQGIIINATIIAALCSVKNKSRQRDPEMHQTRKGSQWYFGIFVYIFAVDLAFISSLMVAKSKVLNRAFRLLCCLLDFNLGVKFLGLH